MNLSFLMPQSLLFKVIAWLAVITFVVGSLVAIANHFENIGYQRRVAEDQVNLNKELIEAKSQTQELQHQLNEAQNELNQSKTQIFTLTSANRAYVGKLWNSINTFNGGLSNDPRETLARRVASLSSVVEDCSARLTEVANDADTAIAEVKMLEKAWPQ